MLSIFCASAMQRLLLASASPQRAALLRGLGFPFDIEPSRVDEAAFPEQDPVQRARDLSTCKARDVASRHPGRIVIGCDTLVVAADGTLLEKPSDARDAERMIRLQSGRTSWVHSGLTVVDAAGAVSTAVSSSSVTFAPLDDASIAWWIDSTLWRDRSGAFQIDGPGQLLIAHIDGDWTSIVGLPVYELGVLLRRIGYGWHAA